MKNKRTNYIIIMAAAGLLAAACSQDYLEEDQRTKNDGLILNFVPGTYASEADVMSGLRLYAFQRGGNGDRYFSHAIPGLTRTGSTLKGNMRVGDWYLNMISLQSNGLSSSETDFKQAPEQSHSFTEPVYGKPMEELEMYSWTPGKGLELNAKQIWFQSQALPSIEADKSVEVKTKLARNNTLITLDISYPITMAAGGGTGGDFTDVPSGAVIQDIKLSQVVLRNVPSTVSWSGKSINTTDVTLPSSDALPDGAKSSFSENGISWEKVKYTGLLVPAYRGSDFWGSDGEQNESPLDILSTKLILEVTLTGTLKNVGTQQSTTQKFTYSKEIPNVPKCNTQYQIHAKLSSAKADMSLKVDEWELETVDVPISGSVSLSIFPSIVRRLAKNTTHTFEFQVQSNRPVSLELLTMSADSENFTPIKGDLDEATNEMEYKIFAADFLNGRSKSVRVEIKYSNSLPSGTRIGLRFTATSANGTTTLRRRIEFHPQQ